MAYQALARLQRGPIEVMFDGVIRQISRKFDVKVTSSSSLVGHFAYLKGTITPDEAFLLYSRKLSKRASCSIRMTVGEPTKPPIYEQLHLYGVYEDLISDDVPRRQDWYRWG